MKPKIVMCCDAPESVKEAVRQHVGIGLLYHGLIHREIEIGEFRTVQLKGLTVARKTYIAYSKHRPLSSLASEFLSLVRASMNKRIVY